MKENEFLDGVSNIESDVVERFVSMDNKLQKKPINQSRKEYGFALEQSRRAFA